MQRLTASNFYGCHERIVLPSSLGCHSLFHHSTQTRYWAKTSSIVGCPGIWRSMYTKFLVHFLLARQLLSNKHTLTLASIHAKLSNLSIGMLHQRLSTWFQNVIADHPRNFLVMHGPQQGSASKEFPGSQGDRRTKGNHHSGQQGDGHTPQS